MVVDDYQSQHATHSPGCAPVAIRRCRDILEPMSDFFQTGAIATLHRLGNVKIEKLETELENFSLETPMALVLPCHIKEMGTPALNAITGALKRVTYLKQIVVGVDGANAREWRKARRY